MKASAAPKAATLFNWSGFYLGISGGGMRVDTQWTIPGPTVSASGNARIFGGTIGVNWQSGPWVVGIEGDYSSTSYKVSGLPTCGGACNTNFNTLGTVRGRIGWATGATGSLLLYMTGGYAFGGVDNYIGAFNNKTTVDGWTFGGGAEVALIGNLTAKAEYLYVALGSSLSCQVPTCIGPNTNDFVHSRIMRGGLNYKF